MNRRPLILCAVVIAALAVVPALFGSFTVSLLNDIGIGALVALGLVLLTGVGGATSFGQAAFVGIGAYLVFVISDRLGLSPYWMVPLAGVGAALLAAAPTPASGTIQ